MEARHFGILIPNHLSIYRDTLEQIDVTKLLIEKYHGVSAAFTSFIYIYTPDNSDSLLEQTFELAFTVTNIEDIIRRGKVASLLGGVGYVYPLSHI